VEAEQRSNEERRHGGATTNGNTLARKTQDVRTASQFTGSVTGTGDAREKGEGRRTEEGRRRRGSMKKEDI